MSEPKNGVWKRYICRQLNPRFGDRNINTQGYKKRTQKPVAQQRESEPKCRWLKGFWLPYFLAHFAAVCYYCYSNNSRTVRLISPARAQRKFAEIFGEFSAPAVSEFWGWGNIAFLKFSLIFSLKRFLYYVPYGTYGTFWKSIWT